jgi:hypothetical protein
MISSMAIPRRKILVDRDRRKLDLDRNDSVETIRRPAHHFKVEALSIGLEEKCVAWCEQQPLVDDGIQALHSDRFLAGRGCQRPVAVPTVFIAGQERVEVRTSGEVPHRGGR